MMQRTGRYIVFAVLLTLCGTMAYGSESAKAFFFRIGERIDALVLKDLDTTYIALPEHSWRLALNSGSEGIHNSYTTWADLGTPVTLKSQSMPSVDLGFNAGYRGFGGGYSWDLMNAYSTNWHLAFGSKIIGVEFQRNITTNLSGRFFVDGVLDPTAPTLNKNEWRIANTSLAAWYALNAKHYSHNAAIKQSYIQKKSAGSLLLSVAYMSSQMQIIDSDKYLKDEDVLTLIDGVKGMITRQVAAGIGYGINYTPNHGKVLLHASANMQLVFYSINHVMYATPDSVYLPGEPNYALYPAKPVHVTGNLRAAVSWEINEWVHLSAWAQGNHLRFASKGGQLSAMDIRNWDWQAHLTIGVRFGAGKKRVREVLGEIPAADRPELLPRQNRLPQWISDYFFAPL